MAGNSAENAPSRPLAGKVIFITGGNSGIGLACATECAKRGASVAIAARRLDAAQQVATELEHRYGGRALAIACDVSQYEQVREAVRRTVEVLGGLHGAVNAAGGPSVGGHVAEFPVDDFVRTIDTHLLGCFYSVREELRAILETGKGGSIVNISSVTSQVVVGPQAAYIAAKHAVNGLTKTAAAEYTGQGIRVNAVVAGFFETPLLEAMASTHNTTKEESVEFLSTVTPAGRVGQPGECANVVAFLLSEEASYISGACWPVDGAYLTVGRA